MQYFNFHRDGFLCFPTFVVRYGLISFLLGKFVGPGKEFVIMSVSAFKFSLVYGIFSSLFGMLLYFQYASPGMNCFLYYHNFFRTGNELVITYSLLLVSFFGIYMIFLLFHSVGLCIINNFPLLGRSSFYIRAGNEALMFYYYFSSGFFFWYIHNFSPFFTRWTCV